MKSNDQKYYEVMLHFLEVWYENTGSEDLTEILSLGEYLIHGKPADPTMWSYWLEAIQRLEKKGPMYKQLS